MTAGLFLPSQMEKFGETGSNKDDNVLDEH